MESPAVSRQMTAASDDAMAGDDNRKRVPAIRRSYGANCRGPSDGTGQITVRSGRTVRYREQPAPHRLLKRSTRRGQREVEGLARAFKILGDLPDCVPELDAIIFPVRIKLGCFRFRTKLDPLQSGAIAGKEQSSYRCFCEAVEQSGHQSPAHNEDAMRPLAIAKLATDCTNFTKSKLALWNSCNPWQMLLFSFSPVTAMEDQSRRDSRTAFNSMTDSPGLLRALT